MIRVETFLFFILLTADSFEQSSNDLILSIDVSGGAEVFIDEPADGEVISLSPGQDSIDLVAYADGTNVTANCVFVVYFGGRRPMYFKTTAFAHDANRAMLHTNIRGLSMTTQSTNLNLTVDIAVLAPTGDSYAALILARSQITIRVDPPPAAAGEYGFGSLRSDAAAAAAADPMPEPEPIGIRSGFMWTIGAAEGILTGPWSLPCPDIMVCCSR
jgi:hypothetical protein